MLHSTISSSTISTIVRFDSEALAWSFVDRVVKIRTFRVGDYGVDADPAEPFWVRVDELRFPDLYSQQQLERWKCCGRLEH